MNAVNPLPLLPAARSALENLAGAVRQAVDKSAAHTAELSTALAASDVQNAASADPAIAAELARIREAIAARQRRLDDWARDVAVAAQAWQADLEVLQR
jgi:hypothetical protein